MCARLLVLLALFLYSPTFAWSGWIPIPIFEENFGGDEENFSGTSGWVSRYCEDPWTTKDVTGVSPKTDYSCDDQPDWSCYGCNYGTSATWGTSACNDWWGATNDPRDNFLVYEAPGGTFGDVQIDVFFENHDNDTFGVTFRYENSINNYLFLSTRDYLAGTTACSDPSGGNSIKTVLYKIQGTSVWNLTVTELSTKNFAYPQGEASQFRVRSIGNHLEGWLDSNGDQAFSANEKVFDLEDPAFDAGKIGLFAYNNGASTSNCTNNDNVCAFTKVLVSTLLADSDDDGIPDIEDNCPEEANPLQQDGDDDGVGKLCDNCTTVFNPGQEDGDEDGVGDACGLCFTTEGGGGDDDNDGVCNPVDNCPGTPNTFQEDLDADAVGDVCDLCPLDFFDDTDEDGLCADVDNCPDVHNVSQSNIDGDLFGDVCDPCVLDPLNDEDQDGLCGGGDNCPNIYNPEQDDQDDDGVGDSCDVCPGSVGPDNDGDGICPDVDNCVDLPNPGQEDGDEDGLGDLCDPCPTEAENDADSDGLCASVDLCPEVYDPDQNDGDDDGIGDLCDPCKGSNESGDSDSDGVCDDLDLCPLDANAVQEDSDDDGVGNACDNCKSTSNPEQENHDGDAKGNACDDDDDNDGLSDDGEEFWGTDPLDADSDDDGVPDGLEPQNDLDGDGLIGALDPDRDNDGIVDGVELGYTTAQSDTHPSGPFDGDLDPDSTTNADDPDTDDDGLLDGEEDSNGNGRVDPGESDPNDPNDPPVLLPDGGTVVSDQGADEGPGSDPGVSSDDGLPPEDGHDEETTPLRSNPGLVYPDSIPGNVGVYPTNPAWDQPNTSSSGCSAGQSSGGSWLFVLCFGFLFSLMRRRRLNQA